MLKENEDFARNLKLLMLQSGINQAELAKKMGVSQAQVSKYITGQDFPTWRKTKMLLRILRCTPDELLGEVPSVAAVKEEIKPLDKEQLLAELEKRGFPAECLEFIRRLDGVKLDDWQVAAIDAILGKSQKK